MKFLSISVANLCFGSKNIHNNYIKSYDRWKFEEDKEKGFGFICIDTETNKYYYRKIPNINAIDYDTVYLTTLTLHTIEDVNVAIQYTDQVLSEKDNSYVRILIKVEDDKTMNPLTLSTIRNYFINNKRVKIVVKDLYKKKKSETKKKENVNENNKFSFILDSSKTEAEIIQKYILETKDKTYDLDSISKVIDKYIVK